MVDDVVINKAAIIERCLARVRTEHAGDDRNRALDLAIVGSIVRDRLGDLQSFARWALTRSRAT